MTDWEYHIATLEPGWYEFPAQIGGEEEGWELMQVVVYRDGKVDLVFRRPREEVPPAGKHILKCRGAGDEEK